MTYRAILNIDFGAETFECLINPVYIGVKEVSQPDLTYKPKFICFYNERRPHMSIGYQTSSKVHEQSGPQARLWKGYQPPVSTV